MPLPQASQSFRNRLPTATTKHSANAPSFRQGPQLGSCNHVPLSLWLSPDPGHSRLPVAAWLVALGKVHEVLALDVV